MDKKWRGFKSWTRRHKLVELVVALILAVKGNFSGFLAIYLFTKTKILNSILLGYTSFSCVSELHFTSFFFFTKIWLKIIPFSSHVYHGSHYLQTFCKDNLKELQSRETSKQCCCCSCCCYCPQKPAKPILKLQNNVVVFIAHRSQPSPFSNYKIMLLLLLLLRTEASQAHSQTSNNVVVVIAHRSQPSPLRRPFWSSAAGPSYHTTRPTDSTCPDLYSCSSRCTRLGCSPSGS